MKKTRIFLSPARKTSSSVSLSVCHSVGVWGVGWLLCPAVYGRARLYSDAGGHGRGGVGHPLDPYGRDLGDPPRPPLRVSAWLSTVLLSVFYRRASCCNALFLCAKTVLPTAPILDRFVLQDWQSRIKKTGLLTSVLFWFRLAWFSPRFPFRTSFYDAVALSAARRTALKVRVLRHPRFHSTDAVYALLRDLYARKRRTLTGLLRRQETVLLRRRYSYAPLFAQAYVPFFHRPGVSHFVYWYGQKFVDPVLEPLVPIPEGYKSLFLRSAREHRVRVYPAIKRWQRAAWARDRSLGRFGCRNREHSRALGTFYLKRRLAQGVPAPVTWSTAPRLGALALLFGKSLKTFSLFCAPTPACWSLRSSSRRSLQAARLLFFPAKRGREKTKKLLFRPGSARVRGGGSRSLARTFYAHYYNKEPPASFLLTHAFAPRWRHARFQQWAGGVHPLLRRRPAVSRRVLARRLTPALLRQRTCQALRWRWGWLLRHGLAKSAFSIAPRAFGQPLGVRAPLVHLLGYGSRQPVFVKRADHPPFVSFQLLLRRQTPQSSLRPSPCLVDGAGQRGVQGCWSLRSVRRLAAYVERVLAPLRPRVLAPLSATVSGGLDALFFKALRSGRVQGAAPLFWLQARAVGMLYKPPFASSPLHPITGKRASAPSYGQGRVVLTLNSHSVFLTVSEPSGRVFFQTTVASLLRAHKKQATKRRSPDTAPVSFKFRRANFRQAYQRLLQEGLRGKRSKQARRKQMKLILRQTKGRRRKRYPQGRAARLTGETMRPLFQVLERVFAGLHSRGLLARMIAMSRSCFRLEAKLTKLRVLPYSPHVHEIVRRLERRLKLLSQLGSPLRLWGFRDKKKFYPSVRLSAPVASPWSVRRTPLFVRGQRPTVRDAPVELRRKLRTVTPQMQRALHKPPSRHRIEPGSPLPSLLLLCQRARLAPSVSARYLRLYAHGQRGRSPARQRSGGRRALLGKRFVSRAGKRFSFYQRRRSSLGFLSSRSFVGVRPNPEPPRDYVFVVRGFSTQLVRRAFASLFGRLLHTLAKHARIARLNRVRSWLRARLYRSSVCSLDA